MLWLTDCSWRHVDRILSGHAVRRRTKEPVLFCFHLAKQVFGACNPVSRSITAEGCGQAAFHAACASFLIGHFTQTCQPIALQAKSVSAVEGGGQRPLMCGVFVQRLLIGRQCLIASVLL